VRLSDNADHLRVVAEGMMQTMQPGGTGAEVARGAPYVIAGKTGTAQNTSRKGNISVNPHALPLSLRHQAWFIAYAPVDNPRIAVAVMVEHGGFGASTAGPIARKIMDAYLLGKMPEPERNPEAVAHAGALPVTPTAAVAVPASPVSTGPLPANPAPAAP
jgi:penicillin-binding protein 2